MLSASEVYELVAPSIAFVETETGMGSGILVEGGYVVTNYHVVWPHDGVWVVFPDGSEAHVRVVGWDPFADLAVLGPVSVSAQPLILGDREVMTPGSSVFLVGYPVETDMFPQVSITEGIVSRFREWDLAGLTLFQTDAAIAGGQSGGALVNTGGDVIGISTWGFSEAGFSVATSAADAALIVESLIQEEAVLGWSETRRSPGVGEFALDVELVNRWDNRAFTFVADIGDMLDESPGNGSSTSSRDRMAIAGFVCSLCIPVITVLLIAVATMPSTSETVGDVFVFLLLAGAVLWVTGLVLSLMAKKKAPRHHKLAKAGTIISATSPMLFIAVIILLLIQSLFLF